MVEQDFKNLKVLHDKLGTYSGVGTSMVTLTIAGNSQMHLTTGRLEHELSTCANIKSRL